MIGKWNCQILYTSLGDLVLPVIFLPGPGGDGGWCTYGAVKEGLVTKTGTNVACMACDIGKKTPKSLC